MAAREAYGLAYSGAIGIGFGAFSVEDEIVHGRDFRGGMYQGHARREVDGRVNLRLDLEVPSGVELVSGTSAQDLPHTRTIEHVFPPEFGNGEPQTIHADFGTVHVMVQRIPDEYHHAIEHGFAANAGR